MRPWTLVGLKESDWMLCSYANVARRNIAIWLNWSEMAFTCRCSQLTCGCCMSIHRSDWPDEGHKLRSESLMLSISSCMLACSHVQQGLCALLEFRRAVYCSCWLASLLQPISKVQVDWYENAYFSIVLQPLAYLYSCRLRHLAGVVVNSRMDDVSMMVARETWP